MIPFHNNVLGGSRVIVGVVGEEVEAAGLAREECRGFPLCVIQFRRIGVRIFFDSSER